MQDHETRGLLGSAYDEMTAEQRQQAESVEAALDAKYGAAIDPGWGYTTDPRTDAAAAALAVIVGDATLEEVSGRYRAARAALDREHAALTGAILASQGSERDLGNRAGVARETVRKALGRS